MSQYQLFSDFRGQSPYVYWKLRPEIELPLRHFGICPRKFSQMLQPGSEGEGMTVAE